MTDLSATGLPVRSGRRGPARLLLVEPDFVMRRTVAMTARSIDIAEVAEAATFARGDELLAQQAYDGLLVSLDAQGEGLKLVQAVRDGRTETAAQAPMAVLVEKIDAATVLALKTHGIARVMLKPCKVRTLLECIEALAR
jgi:DNA-binding response OmpR family regulator